MYDIEKLGKIIADIDKNFAELKSFGLNEKTLNDSKTFYASSMAIFGILSRVIDLAEEIIVRNHFGMPQSYEEHFEVLSNNGIIDKRFSEELKKIAKSRNLFAHEYYSLKRKEVLKLSRDIYIVKDFAERIKKLVAKQK